MNNFILGPTGFLASSEYNKETNTLDIVWVSEIRNAKRFTKKSAISTIAKLKIQGFVWNPFREEPIRNKYEVVKRKETFSWKDKTDSILEYYPQKLIMGNKTDLKYLSNINSEPKKYYDYDEAVTICKELNKDILVELKEKNLI